MRVPGATRLGLSAAILLVATGCGSAGVPAPATPAASATPQASMTSAATPTQATSALSATPGPSHDVSAATSPGLPSNIPGVAVVMDPALLQVLPATIGAARVEMEPESFGEAVQDPSFAANVDAAAFAIVTDGEDLASGVVAHLRPDVYSEALFRDWRDSYDEGACGQAGGVAARAQITLGDRPAYVTTCAGGLRVYHAYVPEREVIVSLFSLGERRFGEQLVAGLRP
jgi:hypothetical protein